MRANELSKMVLGLSFGLLSLASTRGLAATEPETVVLAPENIIFQGEKVDPASSAAQVVFRLGIRTNDVTVSVCTMTAIAKDILLTAAHCEQEGREHLLLSYDPVTGKAKHIVIKKFIKHPRYQQRKGPDGGDESTHDIALVKLERPLALKQYAHIPEPGYRVPPGTQVTTLGYGMNGRPVTEQDLRSRPEVLALVEEMKNPKLTETEKQKLFARLLFVSQENPLLRAESTARIEKVKFAVTPVLHLQSENPLCGGDSGGPTFLKSKDKLIQIGVHSLSQGGANCDKGQEEFLWGMIKGDNLRSWDSYVPFYADWIKQEVEKLRKEIDL